MLLIRRGLRNGGGLLARTRVFLERRAALAVPETLLSRASYSVLDNISGDSHSKYTFAWEEPFEEGAEAEVKDEVSSVAGQNGRLSRQLIRLGDDESVTPLLQQWMDEGNGLPKNAAIVALTNLKRHRRYKQALEVANFVWSKKLFDMDDMDHMYRLYFTGQVGSIEDVERCFAEVPENCATERVYNQLMSCYIARGLVAEAEKTLQKLCLSGHPVSALPFSHLLSLYGHQGQFDKAFKLMQEMTEAKILPDTRTYNILISLTLKQGDKEKVLSLYNVMKDTGVTPDSFTCSMVIKAYMGTGMEEEALRLTEEMMNRSPQEHLLANDLMLAVYADHGKEKELKMLWSRIQSSSKLSARTYGVMIESLGKLGLIQEAEDLAIKAERKRGRLVARIFNALLDVYARHGRMEAAEELMLRITKERLRPSTVTYRHLIAGYLKVGQVEKALEYLKTSRESLTYDHSRPWSVSLLLVLHYVGEQGDVELAEHIFETFTSAGPYRSTLVYNTLLKAYLNSNRLAKDFVQRMSNDGFQPDSETHAMLKQMQAFTREV
ncbi:hypothetical protein GOP47_0026226 [Adiantum capillus-veneris]|nr:hypothetical protein GOP47_0026226 [Adiantum capillus-veneris]